MLYGSEVIQNDVIISAKKYADENDMKIVFGSMVGSISKGLQYADSDYDTRFLYVRKDFSEKICIPNEMKEDELVKRFYPEEEHIYEWIPFWELTSFLNFLETPSFKDDFSVGLYNIVGWTFQSPYQWDPYGIRNKIMPLMDDIFIKEYEINYHLKEIERWYNTNSKQIIAKDYMYALHAALTIDWSIKKNTQPPIYTETLLRGCNDDVLCNAALDFIKIAQEDSKKLGTGNISEMHNTHFKIMTNHINAVDEYIEKMNKKGKLYSEKFILDSDRKKYISNMVNQMIELIRNSINED